MVKKETADVEGTVIQLSNDVSKLENQKIEQQNQFAQREQEKRDILVPEIERMQQMILSTKRDLEQGDDQLAKGDADNAQLELEIEEA